MARYRGFDYLTTRRFLQKTYGEDGMLACSEKLKPLGFAGAVDDVIYAEDWRTLEEYQALVRVIEELHPGAALALGHYSCDDQLRFYHRVAMRLMKPAWLLDNAMSLWRKYCDAGHWEVRWSRPQHAIAELHDLPTTEPAYCVSMTGFFERFLQLCGCRDVRLMHTACRADGDPICRWEGTWR